MYNSAALNKRRFSLPFKNSPFLNFYILKREVGTKEEVSKFIPLGGINGVIVGKRQALELTYGEQEIGNLEPTFFTPTSPVPTCGDWGNIGD